jgi:hypothetical protein
MINAINIKVKHTRGISMANNHRLLPLLLLLWMGRSKDSGGGIGVGGGGMATTTPVGRSVGDVESSSAMNNTGASVVVVVVLVIVSTMVGTNDGTDVMYKEGGTLTERNCVGDEDGTTVVRDDPKDGDGSDGAIVVEPGGVTLMICPCTISNMGTEHNIITIIIIIIRMLLNTKRNDDTVVVSTVVGGGDEQDTLRSCLDDRKED